MACFSINSKELGELEQKLIDVKGNSEFVINEVIHEQAGTIIHDEIMRLMPVSKVKAWKGKKKHAKYSKSLLIDKKEHLSVMIRTKYNYHYLYFPDDGTTTRRHVGNKQFFLKGAENETNEVIDLCVSRLIEEIET